MSDHYDPFREAPTPGDVIFPDLQRVIDEAVGPYGERRFYPLAMHPASFRERWMVDRLRRIEAIREGGSKSAEAIAYHVGKIVEVEAGELERKAAFLRAWAANYKGVE